MGELISFPERCRGCDGPGEETAREGHPKLCANCRSRLRRNLFGSLPATHQAHIESATWAACLAQSRRSSRSHVESRAREMFSEIAARALRGVHEDVGALAALLGFPHTDPARDPQVQWLLGEIASPLRVRQRSHDVYFLDRGRHRIPGAETDGAETPQGRRSVAKYVSGTDTLVDRSTPEPGLGAPARSPEQAADDAGWADSMRGLLAMLVAHYGERDDAVTVMAALAADRALRDEAGVRPGAGVKGKLPVSQIARKLQGTAPERPWDNKPWTDRRVDNAREKIGRFCAQRLPSDPDRRRSVLAQYWAAYCRAHGLRP